MRKVMFAASLLAAVLAVAGIRFGGGQWPFPGSHARAEESRPVLYYRDPDGKPDYSSEPKTTTDGRAYLPVYEGEEAPLVAKKAVPTTASAAPRKIKYYRNPMGLPDVSATPKKDSMGMDYIPVYEGEDEDSGSGTVKISLDRVQRTGVRTEAVGMRRLAVPVRAPGVAQVDERSLRVVSLRADGFIEKLYVNETGRHVSAGEPLFRVYSPDMVKAQVDFRIAQQDKSGGRDLRGAEQRLRNYAVPEPVIAEAIRTGQPVMAFDWPAPITGFVLSKPAIEGQMAKAGEELFRIADLSHMWVIADVPESEIGRVEIGAGATVTFRAYPDEPRAAKVTFVQHELDPRTRTAKVRIELDNPSHKLKHEMYADVVIDGSANDGERLAVPSSAVIDSGTRTVVLVDRGEGKFEPRKVKLGLRSDGHVEVREGLTAGEKVVVAGNFLIDAESNLKAALDAFNGDNAQK
jgi:membrane fusion protein, copper/silver efflux system